MLHRLFGYLRCDLALDLGTANTLIGVAGQGIVVDEPSIVAVRDDTRRILSGGCAVGHLAKQMQGRTPDSISVVRPLAGGVIADFELAEAMLRYLLDKARRGRGRIKPRVLVAVPGCITPVEKRAVFNSTLRAGAGQVFLLPEAKAAAIGTGLPVAEPLGSMVCDIGGGTTEVGVTCLGDVVAGESIRVGGDAMDRAVVDYLRRHHALRIGLPAAERLRIELGSAAALPEELVGEINGVDIVSGLPRKAILTSEEIRESLAEPLEAVAEAVAATLDRCTPEVAADLMDHGLVLCGGGALLRNIDRFLARRTGLPTRVAAEPLAAVIRGASICLEHFQQWRPALQSSYDDV